MLYASATFCIKMFFSLEWSVLDFPVFLLEEPNRKSTNFVPTESDEKHPRNHCVRFVELKPKESDECCKAFCKIIITAIKYLIRRWQRWTGKQRAITLFIYRRFDLFKEKKKPS